MIVACDPGLAGAFAFMDAHALTFHDMPTFNREVRGKKRSTLDELALFDILRQASLFGAEILVIENVGGVQGQSASAAFTFGYGVGMTVAAARLQGMTAERVAATVWKKALRCPRDKEEARIRAGELMPAHAHLWSRKGQHGRAEAAMIGYWWLNRSGPTTVFRYGAV